MNTSELIKILAKRLNVSQNSARTILHTNLEQLRTSLARGETMHLPGLGYIEIVTKKAHRHYIPSKNAVCIVPERKRARFKIDKLFKSLLPRKPS